MKHNLPGLHTLRFMAATLVFLHHYGNGGKFVRAGFVGVPIFFVLSGFIITYIYRSDFHVFSWPTYRSFILKRFARIYPTYLLAFLCSVVFSFLFATSNHGWLKAVLGVTLQQALFDVTKFSYVSQAWSLTVECHFYLLAPFLLCLRGFWLKAALAMSLLLALILTMGRQHFLLCYTLLGYLFAFMVGIAVATWFGRDRTLPGKFFGISSFFLLGFILFLGHLDYASYAKQGLYVTETLWGGFLYVVVLPLAIGFFLISFLQTTTPVHRVLNHPLLETLGKASYAFYLFHFAGFSCVVPGPLILKYSLLYAGSLAIYAFYEEPLRKKIISRAAAL